MAKCRSLMRNFWDPHVSDVCPLVTGDKWTKWWIPPTTRHSALCSATGTKLNLSRVQPVESSENWASSVRSCSQRLQKSSIHVTSFKHVNSCNSALPNLRIPRSFADHMDVLSQIAKASTITRMCFTNIRGYQKSTATITLRWQTNKYCQSRISVCNRAWT
jgi:hypothetical protein